MKRELLLYLSKLDCSANVAVAPTLAWLAKSLGYLFDSYYDSYHQGCHFPGGDSRNLETGQMTGGTVSADRHFEEFYFLLHHFNVIVLSFEDTIFLSSLKNLGVPIVSLSHQINSLYKNVFHSLHVPVPSEIVMIGTHFNGSLSGLEAYFYPEIYFRQAIGVPDSIKEEELDDLCEKGSKIFCLCVNESRISQLRSKPYDIEIIDQLKQDDDYLSITKRIVSRWQDRAKGWILGDPILVNHWLPKACEENLLSIYSIPQEKILPELKDLIPSKGTVVYGRQYSDRDFFELSKLNQCLQVIDPCRPPFQSVKHIDYTWNTHQHSEGFYAPEYTDEELKEFAQKNIILISLMFWSGMIREIANFYNLMDLFAITKLKCGLVLTSQSFEYMMHSPLELLSIPWEQGGVYSLVEPVLGSCGIGVGIESYIKTERLLETVCESISLIRQKVKSEKYAPRGWWTTMDADLEKLPFNKRPKPVRFLRYPPYFQIRYTPEDRSFDVNSSPADATIADSFKRSLINRIKQALLKAGLNKYFEQYRPYESYHAGPIKNSVIDVAQSAGLKYMFTKAGFNKYPEIKYLNDNFIALNYTSGQWDGWTPFETINDVSDLKKSEKILLKKKEPGWIVSTIDSCLWTFSGEFWKRGNRLYEIAQFCSNGGDSHQLINVKPITIARYARIIAAKNF